MSVTNGGVPTVRFAQPQDYSQWHRLWTEYLEYYREENFSGEITALLWNRIFDVSNPVKCIVATSEGDTQLIGIVHFFSHVDTWSDQPSCYLADLYVDTDIRGRGVGNMLIDAVVRDAKFTNCSSVYWKTEENNATARVLYDRITGGSNGFVGYEIDLLKDN